MGALGSVAKLFAEGGIQVCTSEHSKEDVAGPQTLLAKTVIQPDADVTTYASAEALGRPDVWRRHQARVRQEVESLRRLRLIVTHGRLTFTVPLLWPILGYGPEVWLLAMFVSGLLFFSKPIMVWVVRLVMRRTMRG